MKPLHVLDMSMPHVAGYTSRARSIMIGQAAAGLEPIAVTSVRQTGAPQGCEEIDGFRHYRTGMTRLVRGAASVPVARELTEMAALSRRILEIRQRCEHIDLVHAHSPVLCGIPARSAAHRLGVPCVYEIRAFWEDAAVNRGRSFESSPRYAAVRALETNLVHGVDAVVVICEGIRRDLLARGVDPERVFTVPNGVDADRFRPMPRDDKLAGELGFEGKTVIAYVGTLFAFEGVGLLLDALDRLTRERDDIRGLIVGYGETETALRQQHARLGLEGRVVLTGKVPPSEVHRYYSVADVLCYPRERHRITELTTPLKPLEAMSMEKAVLGSDVGGIRELVRDRETGLCFRAGDVEDLVRAARQLVLDPALRRQLGAAARREMIEERDWRKLARGYLDAYAAAADRYAARQRARMPAPRAA